MALGLPSALLILFNWLSVIGYGIAAWRGHRGGHSFAPPFLSGIAGAVACLVCPWSGAWWWAWVPLLTDPSIGLWVIAIVLQAMARLVGLRAPIDRLPPQSSTE
ncbi:hypothetical protein FRUB_01576 [Fimbriiglobus ruber]|uniref:Uncharacterized protein n=1 Tax=Fimbriiglobus ruber TaxID=1908690 RepID=A0A225E9J1_9BACT|nr:hypothetical protein FRUB_01576 [Fimbriiglobus ruber]